MEKTSGTPTSTVYLLWCGMELCEERTGTNGGTVSKRFFPYGSQEGSDEYDYNRDHLGSVREVTDDSGSLVARYDYDPWGRRTQLYGTAQPPFGYAGYYLHGPTGLNLAVFRAYDPDLGQWLSRDPIGEAGGIRLHGYVGNDPVNGVDPLGLSTYICRKPLDKLNSTNELEGHENRWDNQRSGPDVPGNPLYHQYLCTIIGTELTCGGLTSANDSAFGPGAKSNDEFVPQRCEKANEDDSCIDECVEDAIKGDRPDTYSLVNVGGENCQKWSSDEYERCLDQCGR